MIATIETSPIVPVGIIFFLAAAAVAVTLGFLTKNPDRLSDFARKFAAIMTALLLPAGIYVMCLPHEASRYGGIDSEEAFTSFFILVGGAFGAGLGCTRSNKRRLIVEGLIVSSLAGITIILVALDFGLIGLARPDTPVQTAATIALVVAAFGYRLTMLLLRLRRHTDL